MCIFLLTFLKFHLKNIYQKLGVAYREEAIAKYLESIRECGVSNRGMFWFVSAVASQTGIPSFKYRPERTIERARPCLQQQMGSAGRPLHLLTFRESLADHRIDRGLSQSGNDSLAGLRHKHPTLPYALLQWGHGIFIVESHRTAGRCTFHLHASTGPWHLYRGILDLNWRLASW